jgi:hypothetical protein
MASLDGNNPFDSLVDSLACYVPYVVGVAGSRGGGTLMAALGRVGIIESIIAGRCKNDAKACPFSSDFVKDSTTFFTSAAAFYYTPTSLLVGQFRFLTQDMMSGKIPFNLTALPMVPDMVHEFDAYRNATPGSTEEATELANLVGYIGSSDVMYIAPYLSVAVQNWNSNILNGSSKHFMPGSLIFVHGTQDAVVPFTESLIAKTAMDGVFNSIYGASASKNPLVKSYITAVGSQFYSFQPDASFYNLKLGSVGCNNTLDAAGNYPVNFNPSKGQCFGGGYAGAELVKFGDHSVDSAFLTSRIENATFEDQSVDANTDLSSELLYGVAASSESNKGDEPYTFAKQFEFFNKGVSVPFDFSQYGPDSCNTPDKPPTNGVCYAMGFNSKKKDTQSYPLYYRSLGEDKAGPHAKALLGVWDDNTQKNSQLSPTDLMTRWLDVVVLSPDQGVFAQFKDK